jgi:hypothetical protein
MMPLNMLLSALLWTSTVAFVHQTPQRWATTSLSASTRKEFFQQAKIAASSMAVIAAITGTPEVASARGRATLEQAYRKYTPRILAGGAFYASEMKQLVASANFAAIQNSLREPPSRQKDDLKKPDSGVADRARLAGQFSDARVLTAADLYAAAFSESSISPKTKKMQAAVAKMRSVVEEMEEVCKQALGESSGGLFGLGAKKVDKTELAKQLRTLYVDGGNAYNEYILTANQDLALQFDKLPFIK